MADWSFGGLKKNVSGLLNDPQQSQALLSNPMFGMGMGLLSSSYDPSVNPFQAAYSGLAQSQQNKQEQEERKREEQLRKDLAAFLAKQGTAPGGPQGAPGGPPTPGAGPMPGGQPMSAGAQMPPPVSPQMQGTPPMPGQGGETERLMRLLGWRNAMNR